MITDKFLYDFGLDAVDFFVNGLFFSMLSLINLLLIKILISEHFIAKKLPAVLQVKPLGGAQTQMAEIVLNYNSIFDFYMQGLKTNIHIKPYKNIVKKHCKKTLLNLLTKFADYSIMS